MAWKRTNRIEGTRIITKAIWCDSVWVCRLPTSVAGIIEGNNALHWEHSLEGDELFGPKRLVEGAAGVVTLVAMQPFRPTRLVCVSSDTGDIVWDQQYPIERLSAGMTTHDDHVYLIGESGSQQYDQQWSVLQIRCSDGAVEADWPAPTDGQLFCAGNRIYLACTSQGLYATPLDGTWQHHCEKGVTQVTARDGQLYGFARVSPPSTPMQYALIWWDGASGEERGRIDHDMDSVLILKATSKSGVVIGYVDRIGVGVFDLAKSTRLWWQESGENKRIEAVTATPYGIVISSSTNQQSMLNLYSQTDGTDLGPIDTELSYIRGLDWLGNRLIASATFGLEIFSWED